MRLEDGRQRAVIEGVYPEIDCGQFPIKRTTGEKVVVEADIFTDGHDALSALLLYRREDAPEWCETPMTFLVNDRWRAEFTVGEIGRYCYTVMAWVDHFKTWAGDLAKRIQAGQDVTVELEIGARMVDEASQRASGADAAALKTVAETLHHGGDTAIAAALSPELSDLMFRYADRSCATTYGKELAVVVDRERARFSAWYELFPRSTAKDAGRHGTFRDAEERLPYVAAMGFDVLYLPPIHPIGVTKRKGRNNTLVAGPGDPGSPWAIGNKAGGHKAVNPELGTLEDFRRFVQRANEYGLEVALDIAFQTSPDHPYVEKHPEWFRWRPDNTVQYAENPPKKYEDIYPFNFESEKWRELWEELKSVFTFWIEQGVKIFRVDNPHTKPFAFWEWCISEIKQQYPEVIFLSEAFTRPKVMYRLAKLGFTQSYTYFTWRNTKWELQEYLTELTQTQVREFFRPNFWPNTPDILPEALQIGGRPAFMSRLVLAATLAANYGIYGPAFELCVNEPTMRGKEEYLYSEKYEIKHWDVDRPDSLSRFIGQVNQIRRENPALQSNLRLRFHGVDNDYLICYSKTTEDLSNVILVVVNLDPHYTQSGWVNLALDQLGVDHEHPFQIHDLLTGERYLWNGSRNYVELNPHAIPAHIFRVRRHLRTEQDFEYYM
ncbi:MAG: alpha-1,4-glucan:maltose-1-phosphate maltosyltransferase [Herpetosiphonaceae bacterium]|nr:MAG: alpha-1,4-glucan:maltose-1-phosphate maltosyltransferase [Herpetosiphonaceae bacterium]